MPRALHFSATILFSGLKLRVPAVCLPDPRGSSASGANEVSRQNGKGRMAGKNAPQTGTRGPLASKKTGGGQGRAWGAKASHRVLSEMPAEGQGTGCQKPSPERAGTSAVKGAPSVAKRNSLTQKSQGQLWKRTRGLTEQTACAFTALRRHIHSQAGHPGSTGEEACLPSGRAPSLALQSQTRAGSTQSGH